MDSITLYIPVKRVLITDHLYEDEDHKKRQKYIQGGNVVNSDRYKYMSIRQLQDLSDELKEEAKHDPSRDTEYHVVYKALQDKIRERDKSRPKCIPSRFEHDLDLMEEF